MRYTIKDMENMSDRQFIVNILEERRGKCTNPYSPLCERLNKVICMVENNSDLGDWGKKELN